MKKKRNNLLTKSYLDKRLTRLKYELLPEMKNELYQIKDKIVGEIKALREEFSIHQFGKLETPV